MTAPAGQTLPPDPSVAGLWWMRNVTPQQGARWRVWAWLPEIGGWGTGTSYHHPAQVWAAGWRCMKAAEPPEVQP